VFDRIEAGESRGRKNSLAPAARISRVSAARETRFPSPRSYSFRGQIQELPFHAIDLSEICSDVVIATAPPGHEAEAAARECPRRTCAAPLGITVMVNSIFNSWRFEEARLDNL